MGNDCKGTLENKSFIFIKPDLISRNSYITENSSSSPTSSSIFESQQCKRKYTPLIKDIEKNKNQIFHDKNFILTQSTKLSLLYNYNHMHAIIYSFEDTLYNSFDESEVQFSYLATVFYFYSNNKHLLDKVFETKQINDYDLYVLKFHCLGQQHEIVIDDCVPTKKQSLQFCKIIRGRQLWPILVQKAWCKQIGGYQLAKGLSPEDSFQQITGIPAYSYSFDSRRHNITLQLQSALKSKYWISIIARINVKGLQNRQVFYLQKIQSDQFWIRSAYSHYNLKNHSIQDTNLVKISINELLTYFQFYTIGYYNPQYQILNYKHKSKKYEQVFYEFFVSNQQDVNIRFIQYYNGYFNEKDRQQYDYSSVFLELYDQHFELVESCQGCDKALSGSRSSHLSSQIMTGLRRGKYYLKVEVDWVNEIILDEGNICIYSSRNNIKFTKTQQKITQLIRNIQSTMLSKISNIKQSSQTIQISSYQKKNGVIISILNSGKNLEKRKIDLSKSKNIRLKYCHTDNMQVTISLAGGQEKFIEIVPYNPREFMEVVPFQVSKA